MTGRRRYAVPAVLAGLIALGSAVPAMSASASPRLPAVTPAALAGKVLTEHVTAFSGTVRWSADLGLPSLSTLTSGGGQSPSSGAGFDPTSLLSGTHTFSLWVDGPQRQRIASAASLAESDAVHVGNQVWTWDSSTQHVTHDVFQGGPSAAHHSAAFAADPQAVADRLVAGLEQHDTAISVSPPVRVAGVPAYVLRLSPTGPAASASRVAAVEVAVDAANGLPLRVEVDAVGQRTPALSLGFTSITFGVPAASNFTPPHGRTTATHVIPVTAAHRQRDAAPDGASVIGTGWQAVGVLTDSPSASSTARYLDKVTTPVSGAWGTGRLLRTSLVDALFLPDGHVLVGAVQPAVLEAAAAHPGS